ncbi:MAG: hypothetical protein K8R63_04860 [Bacteroidales bacterium]|nr:hypothetical protein [Bacteroidales bacterium]
MKKLKIFTIILLGALTMSSTLLAQGFQPPEEGNAAIYFVRINKVGKWINFKYFDKDKFIGKFGGINYMRYECDPGKHLFWASAENKYFVTTDLKEGGTYIVIVKGKMGGMSAGVRLYTAEDEDMLEKAISIVKKKKPVETSDDIIELENTELKEYIAEKLAAYENDWKDTKDFPNITADMAIPPEKLK